MWLSNHTTYTLSMTQKTKNKKLPKLSNYIEHWVMGSLRSYEQGYTSREILTGVFKRAYGKQYKQAMKKHGVQP